MKIYKVYTDGGARGNPGPAAYGIVIREENSNHPTPLKGYIGIATNNVAEYTAILEALKKLAGLEKEANIDFYMDSQIAKRQLTGEYRVLNQNLLRLYNQIKELEKNFSKVTYTHIRREFNKEADALVNQALDALL